MHGIVGGKSGATIDAYISTLNTDDLHIQFDTDNIILSVQATVQLHEYEYQYCTSSYYVMKLPEQ